MGKKNAKAEEHTEISSYLEVYSVYDASAAMPLCSWKAGVDPKDTSDTDWWNFLMAHLDPSSKGLDIGCGPGAQISKYFESEGHEMLICDAVDYAAYLNHDAFFQYVIPDTIPLADNSRDFIINSAVIQHLNNFQEVQVLIQEVHRVLKPGGIFCLSFKEGYHETNTTVYDLRWERYRTFLVFDRKIVVEYLQKSGFEILEHHGFVDEKRIFYSCIICKKNIVATSANSQN